MYIKIDGKQNNLRFSAAHFIPTIEKCSRLHGHDYSVSLKVTGDPVDGILIDYGIVKQVLRKLIEEIDHKVIVPKSSKFSNVKKTSESYEVEYGGKSYVFPAVDVFELDADFSSSESMCRIMCNRIGERLKSYSNLQKLSVCLYEGPGQSACIELNLNDR
ncbi:MAG: 6-carboxytetrahydropterin synthase [Thermoplasmatales archaeon]|nr:6-carboxytetrahydropterin synthase [Thermoplasmatales archaeon]MCW6169704.1 6-carboxytetrahydropterin synthase [Thermoplasmatales archaeon]